MNAPCICLLFVLFATTNSTIVHAVVTPVVPNFVDMFTDIPDTDGSTPMIHAIHEGDIHAVKNLIAQGANVNYQLPGTGVTPLMLVINGPNNENTIILARLLLDNGAHVDAQNNSGNTALMHALTTNNIAMVKLLLDYGANPTIANQTGLTALGIARFKNHPLLPVINHIADQIERKHNT
jgi:hypothetical protein